mmetsp:Transcript_4245/g.8897  ORF Transcript_4245/g.8897 Transcript_4245/m.8897 type:complete len:121 (-) Transcript_4245:145-507(-)
MGLCTRAGALIYIKATKALSYTFEGKNSSLQALLEAVDSCAQQCGWDDILDITIDQDAAGNNISRSILTHFGEITLEKASQGALEYLGTQSRNAQALHQMHQVLEKSVSTIVKDRMVFLQ